MPNLLTKSLDLTHTAALCSSRGWQGHQTKFICALNYRQRVMLPIFVALLRGLAAAARAHSQISVAIAAAARIHSISYLRSVQVHIPQASAQVHRPQVPVHGVDCK